jgi:hypothetical protein
MYLAGAAEGENAELTNGVPVTEDEIEKDIGKRDSWRRKKPEIRFTAPPRPRQEEKRIKKALSICKQWLE